MEKSRWSLAGISSVCALLMGFAAVPALAQVSKNVSDDDLAAAAEDPTAPLMSFEVRDYYEPSLYDKDGTINQAVFRTVMPFTVGAVNNLFRFTQPDTTQAYNNKLGGSDPELIYLAGSAVPWGRWGIGAVLQPPSGSKELTSNKWSMGPSARVVDTSDPHQQWGVFLRSYTSFAGTEKAKKVGIVNLQPLYTLKLGEGRSLSLGETEAEYDTAKSQWKTLQVGRKFGQVFTFADHKWKPTAEMDYNFCDRSGNARSGISEVLPVIGRTITSSIWRIIQTGTAGLEGVGSPSNLRSHRWDRRRSRSHTEDSGRKSAG